MTQTARPAAHCGEVPVTKTETGEKLVVVLRAEGRAGGLHRFRRQEDTWESRR